MKGNKITLRNVESLTKVLLKAIIAASALSCKKGTLVPANRQLILTISVVQHESLLWTYITGESTYIKPLGHSI